jgi:hypothetical protein
VKQLIVSELATCPLFLFISSSLVPCWVEEFNALLPAPVPLLALFSALSGLSAEQTNRYKVSSQVALCCYYGVQKYKEILLVGVN